MKKKLMALLMAFMLCLPALAETEAEQAPAEAEDAAQVLAPFAFTLPAGLIARYTPGNTFITITDEQQATRVVAMVISRVPDENADHAAELQRLMGQFAPGAQSLTPLSLSEGFHGLMAVSPMSLMGAKDTAVDQLTVMVLWQTPLRGELLILSGYDVNGDTARAQAMLDMLLQAMRVEDVPVVPAAEETLVPVGENPQ